MKGFELPVRPGECVMVFGIPTSRSGFVRHLAHRERHDFVPKVCPAWPAYERLLDQIEPAIAHMIELGVAVRREAPLQQLTEACRSSRVVVLFSHWTDDRVEFDDGLQAIDEVTAAVPSMFNGVIDLCVCHPDSLVMQLRRDRPNCLVKRTRSKARVSYWLQFYEVLFRVLSEREIAYSDAVAVTATALMGDDIAIGDEQ